MSLIFADTHNMVAHLNKSDASEGFHQIIDFLNGSYIKHALTINPHIYVLCIKQFWNIVVVKQSNDVTRLQALVDKKKVVITKATIRDALRLDDAEGVDCLPNEEIFPELARMGYEKPSTKLTFYKAFFSSQWKFLIHTILQSLSAKRTSWNEFSSAMASAVIFLSTGQKFNFSKYIFESLVRNIDSSSKFYMYPRFIQLIIQNQLGVIEEQGNAEEQVQDDVDDAAAPGADTNRIDSSDDTKMEDASNQGRMIDELDMDEGVALMDDKGAKQKEKEAQVAGDDQVKGRQAEIYQIDMDHDLKVLSMQKDDPEVQEVVDVVTTTKLITEVVTAASESGSAASIIIDVVELQVPAAIITAVPVRVDASTRRRKGVVIKDPEEKSTTIRPAKTKSKDKRYQVMKKRPQTEAQARKNMMMYMKNVVGFRLDYFKGMSYDDIRPIFEAKFNSNIKFLLKTKEQLEEEENRAIQSINETLAQKAAKKRKLKI
nr:hypothetical protein [Tanacetum cinerariifolium]